MLLPECGRPGSTGRRNARRSDSGAGCHHLTHRYGMVEVRRVLRQARLHEARGKVAPAGQGAMRLLALNAAWVRGVSLAHSASLCSPSISPFGLGEVSPGVKRLRGSSREE